MPEKEHYEFAAECGKSTLYKFRPFKSGEHRKWVHEIVADHKIYFPRASQLNDPFDLAPVIRLKRDRAAVLAGAEAVWIKSGKMLSAEEWQNQKKYYETAEFEQIEDDGARRVQDGLNRGYWVFSLSGNRDHPMLWSHYAEGHTGLCVHFAADGAALFGGALKVHYVPERPVIPIPLTISEEESMLRAILTCETNTDSLSCDQKRVSLHKAYSINEENLMQYPVMSYGSEYGVLVAPYKFHLSDNSLTGEATVGGIAGYRFQMAGVAVAPVVSAGVGVVSVANSDNDGKFPEILDDVKCAILRACAVDT